MKAKVNLRIGLSGCVREDVIEIDDDAYNECGTDEEKENLLNKYWQEWTWEYIDGGIELIE